MYPASDNQLSDIRNQGMHLPPISKSQQRHTCNSQLKRGYMRSKTLAQAASIDHHHNYDRNMQILHRVRAQLEVAHQMAASKSKD